MSEQIRAAAPADVAAMTTLASIRREQYARYQPLFWRPAAGAQDEHRPYLARLVASDEAVCLVSEEAGQLTGFLIATLTPAAPVCDAKREALRACGLEVASEWWVTPQPLAQGHFVS
jgi:hypothetical protein